MRGILEPRGQNVTLPSRSSTRHSDGSTTISETRSTSSYGPEILHATTATSAFRGQRMKLPH